MTDWELLEMAAKAAGYVPVRWTDDGAALLLEGIQQPWNPLTDDRDALRLAVKLNLEVFTKDEPFDTAAVSRYGMEKIYAELRSDDPYAATRRAIVRAAAALGEAA